MIKGFGRPLRLWVLDLLLKNVYEDKLFHPAL